MRPHLLLLIPSDSYRAADFLSAAAAVGVNVVVACDQHQTLEQQVAGKLLTLNFLDLPGSIARVLSFSKQYPIAAVVPTEDRATFLASVLSEALALPHNPPSAVAATSDKKILRERLQEAGLPCPAFRSYATSLSPKNVSEDVQFPVVLKPTGLSGSQGVIRANGPDEFIAAFERIKRLLNDPDIIQRKGPKPGEILVEQYIPGKEVALEGLLREGELSCLALFDKPDPLEGPYFEETLYVTPSRLPQTLQKDIIAAVSQGVEAIGLKEGPVHAELRISENTELVRKSQREARASLGVAGKARGCTRSGGVAALHDQILGAPQRRQARPGAVAAVGGFPHKLTAWIIEIAARSIGGRCGKVLRFGTGLSLEEIIVRHALLLPLPSLQREKQAAGVMMIPIPKGGFLERTEGLAQAKRVAGVTDIEITAHTGQKLVPLPEGRHYLGFIFAKGQTPEAVEAALRQAHDQLSFVISSE